MHIPDNEKKEEKEATTF